MSARAGRASALRRRDPQAVGSLLPARGVLRSRHFLLQLRVERPPEHSGQRAASNPEDPGLRDAGRQEDRGALPRWKRKDRCGDLRVADLPRADDRELGDKAL